MNFNPQIVDYDAAAVVGDTSFHLSKRPVDVSKLAFCESFESAPDDEAESSSKKLRFASNFEDGKRAEERFLVAAEAQGWQAIPTSSFDDKVRRIDAAFSVKGAGVVLLDIKAAKKLSRADSVPQFRFHWLELHDTGSLFSGDSKVLALEVGDGRFALFNKQDLRDWVLANVRGPPVARSSQALFRPYQRGGKMREWITLVDVASMDHMCLGIL